MSEDKPVDVAANLKILTETPEGQAMLEEFDKAAIKMEEKFAEDNALVLAQFDLEDEEGPPKVNKDAPASLITQKLATYLQTDEGKESMRQNLGLAPIVLTGDVVKAEEPFQVKPPAATNHLGMQYGPNQIALAQALTGHSGRRAIEVLSEIVLTYFGDPQALLNSVPPEVPTWARA